jgi:hypothetical protein
MEEKRGHTALALRRRAPVVLTSHERLRLRLPPRLDEDERPRLDERLRLDELRFDDRPRSSAWPRSSARLRPVERPRPLLTNWPCSSRRRPLAPLLRRRPDELLRDFAIAASPLKHSNAHVTRVGVPTYWFRPDYPTDARRASGPVRQGTPTRTIRASATPCGPGQGSRPKAITCRMSYLRARRRPRRSLRLCD